MGQPGPVLLHGAGLLRRARQHLALSLLLSEERRRLERERGKEEYREQEREIKYAKVLKSLNKILYI